jgi:hypothetical protein
VTIRVGLKKTGGGVHPPAMQNYNALFHLDCDPTSDDDERIRYATEDSFSNIVRESTGSGLATFTTKFCTTAARRNVHSLFAET